MANDWYRSYAELRSQERESRDFAIHVWRRDSPVAIIAPHGGKIEPGTSEIAAEIAGESYSLYRFEGLVDRAHCELHIASTRFDEPECLKLVQGSQTVVSIHGLAGKGKVIYVGGRDFDLRNRIHANLKTAGFLAEIDATGQHSGTDGSNICNKGMRGMGVQIEIVRDLRDELCGEHQAQLATFTHAIREAIAAPRE